MALVFNYVQLAYKTHPAIYIAIILLIIIWAIANERLLPSPPLLLL
jgi:hypothetical protein